MYIIISKKATIVNYYPHATVSPSLINDANFNSHYA